MGNYIFVAVVILASTFFTDVHANPALVSQISSLRASLESFSDNISGRLDDIDYRLNGALADISAVESVLAATSKCSVLGAFYAPQSKDANKQGCLDVSFASFDDQRLKVNGYHMVGDLIIQWGALNHNGENQVFHKVKYSIPFREKVFNIQSSLARDFAVSGTNSTAVRNIGLKGFEIMSDHSRQAAPERIYWLAIGK